MSPDDLQLYEDLHARILFLACKTSLLLSGCKDGDGRIIADERSVMGDVRSGLHHLHRWAERSMPADKVYSGAASSPSKSTAAETSHTGGS